MKIDWYDIYGNVALSKNQYIPLSASESASILTKRRKRAINYLQEAGVRLGVKQYIDILFTHYSAYPVEGITYNYINNYIENGSTEFRDALEAETNQNINAILSAPLSSGGTMKDAIINQIT